MVKKIVLTGAPCGGKTSVMNYLRVELPKIEDITTFFLPELATYLFEAGIDLGKLYKKKEAHYPIQARMLEGQIINESFLEECAHIVEGQNKVLICDRAAIDNFVYLDDRFHVSIGHKYGGFNGLKSRYDYLFFLETLAYGDGYTTANNPARHDTKEEAIERDIRGKEIWAKGPEIPTYILKYDQTLEYKQNFIKEQIIKIARL